MARTPKSPEPAPLEPPAEPVPPSPAAPAPAPPEPPAAPVQVPPSPVPVLQYTPCTIRLDQIDSQTMRHIYCHRDGDSMKWSDDAAPSNLKSLGESLRAEGQLTPIEFYQSDGNNILVRGYRLVEAIQQIITRALDPERFHAAMELKAVEIRGGAEVDYLVRAVASNEVRAALSPEAQYKVAEMLLERGVSEQRGARALGISPTQFGRYVLRHKNPWMQEHVKAKHFSQSKADDLLEAASKVNKIAELQTALTQTVAEIQTHIAAERTKAGANKQKFNDEKQGAVKTYLKKSTLGKIEKAIEKGESYTPPPIVKKSDWTFTCEIDDKSGKLKIAGLNGLVLAQQPYPDLALISGSLHVVAKQAEALYLSAKAKHVATNGHTRTEELLRYFRAVGDTEFAADYAAKVKAETGEPDSGHGKVPPRHETPITAGAGTAQSETGNGHPPASDYDSAIDGGPTG